MPRHRPASFLFAIAFAFHPALLVSTGQAQTATPVVRGAARSDIVDQVMKLLKAKFSEAAILRKIAQVNTPVTLSTDQMIALKGAGASEAVMAALEDPKQAASGTTTISGPATVVVVPPSSAPAKVIVSPPAAPAPAVSTPPPTTTKVTKPGLKQRMIIMAFCGGSAIGGAKLGEKLAEQQAAKMHLPPAQAAALRRKYEIGLALAFCKGGSLLANTVYANLSKRDQEARQKEIDTALSDAQPGTRNYVVPDHPDMKGTLTTTAEVADGDSECRTVEDHLAEGASGDSALVRYCRKPPATNYEVSSGGQG